MSASLWTLARVHATSLARRPMTWVLALVLGAYLLLVDGSFLLLLAAPESEALDTDLIVEPMRLGGLAYVAQLFAGIASICAVVYGSSSIGHEFSRGTVRTALLAGVRRDRFAWALALDLVAASVLLAVVGVAVTFLSAWVFGLAAGEDFLRIQGPTHALLAATSLLLRMTLQFSAWALMAFALTFLTRSLLAGIGGAMALQILGGILGGLVASLGTGGRWVARALVTTAIDRVTLPVTLELEWVDVAWVVANLAVYVLVPLWWGVWRFKRMDVLAVTRVG